MKQIQKITSSNKPERQITKKHTHKNKQTEKKTQTKEYVEQKKKIHHQHITSTGSVDLES
jgi:hypothetical protein